MIVMHHEIRADSETAWINLDVRNYRTDPTPELTEWDLMQPVHNVIWTLPD